MMKRILSWLLALTMLLSISACTNSAPSTDDDATASVSTTSTTIADSDTTESTNTEQTSAITTGTTESTDAEQTSAITTGTTESTDAEQTSAITTTDTTLSTTKATKITKAPKTSTTRKTTKTTKKVVSTTKSTTTTTTKKPTTTTTKKKTTTTILVTNTTTTAKTTTTATTVTTTEESTHTTTRKSVTTTQATTRPSAAPLPSKPTQCVCGATGEDLYWNRTVTKQPTKTEEGIVTYTCYDCGYTFTENVGTYNYDPADYFNPHYVRTSYNPDNYIDFVIDGNILLIAGKVQIEGLKKLTFSCGDYESRELSSGEAFSVELNLSSVDEKTEVEVFYQTEQHDDRTYTGYIYDRISVSPSGDGYCFDPSLVLDHNLNEMKRWADPRQYLSKEISDTLREAARSIIGNETDDYKKMQLIYRWVTENIYYDGSYFHGGAPTTYFDADDVYLHRYTVCAGYARLLQSLLQAVNIPCMYVGVYAIGAGTLGYFDESNYQTESTNHAYVEAYLQSEDRWVIMDATWDSHNGYWFGEFTKRAPQSLYFDMTPGFFAYSHKYIIRNPEY